MIKRKIILFNIDGLRSDRLCVEGDARGSGKLQKGSVKKRKSTRMCSYALENEKYFRACGGTIKCSAPFSAKCNSEKPREMFVIGIVGPCSLGSTCLREKERSVERERAPFLLECARVRVRFCDTFYFVRAPCIRIK